LNTKLINFYYQHKKSNMKKIIKKYVKKFINNFIKKNKYNKLNIVKIKS